MSDTTVQRDYRDTLNLPATTFPMKGDLPKREPERVEWWQRNRTYARRLKRNEGNAPWVLHDGPPYANGELHMGHFLGMVLKDIFVKVPLLEGRFAKFVPGWDMHGLPIELDTLKHLGLKDFHGVDPLELRAACRERALYWLDVQRTTRMRMGNFGEWETPYRTIDPEYEATIVEALADLAQANQIYKGLRSTLWCIHDETALAEAEIEYESKVSPSIYVRFTANDEQRADLAKRFGVAPSELPDRVSVVVWTTTPWTLPANVAIALRPDAAYGIYAFDGTEAVIVAEARAPEVFGERFAAARLLARSDGAALEGAEVRHPFVDRDSEIVLADYVDLETGTGAVHTAPGHGADDFDTALKYNLPIVMPVDARGVFTSEGGVYAGLQVFEANERIISDLRASGALLRAEEYTHSYPHCWRCHNPVIFRATAQWFIAMDQNRLRARTIDAIKSVGWVPSWGELRITQMLENHPEWCISRQRTWGTPIPAVVCVGCGEAILSPEVARIAARRFREVGANAWYSDDVATFLPPGFSCPKCHGTRFEKEKNIVDIWFESGVSHLAVLGKNGMPWPSDVVLEGGDQYRGWFRSSIVTAVAVKNAPPYRHVVKNGWVNDAEGKAMSKSLGNYVAADQAMQKYGADVLRLWAASVEYVDDVRFGDVMMEQVARVYRNIRNRLRFMISNIGDLAPGDVLPREKMLPFDVLACAAVDDWVRRVRSAFAGFNLHDAYLEIVRFEGEDLSSFYLDALKDRLYSSLPDAPRRRSAQSALWHILKNVLAVVAAILSFTAEEAWQHVPVRLRGERESVFDLELHGAAHVDHRALGVWNALKGLRSEVAAHEAVRDFGARATVRAGGPLLEQLRALGDNLREALVVSHVELIERHEDGAVVESIQPAEGAKCARCWKVLPLGIDPEHPSLCAPCAGIVQELDRRKAS